MTWSYAYRDKQKHSTTKLLEVIKKEVISKQKFMWYKMSTDKNTVTEVIGKEINLSVLLTIIPYTKYLLLTLMTVVNEIYSKL